jgi:hypothetical protein
MQKTPGRDKISMTINYFTNKINVGTLSTNQRFSELAKLENSITATKKRKPTYSDEYRVKTDRIVSSHLKHTPNRFGKFYLNNFYSRDFCKSTIFNHTICPISNKSNSEIRCFLVIQ